VKACRGSPDGTACSPRRRAGFDVAETLAKGQPGEGKTNELTEAGKAAQFVIAPVTLDALVELARRDVIDQLGEDGAADVHVPLSAGAAGWVPGSQDGRRKLKSKKAQTPFMCMNGWELSRGPKAIAGQ
jgi:hypothetical protein